MTAGSHALLRAIGATARPAGSAAESAARGLCAEWLRDAGFRVVERPFKYSTLPGIWGTPIIGLALCVTAAGLAGRLARSGAGGDAPVGAALAALVMIGFIGWWLSRYGTRVLPVMRRPGVNLEAQPGVAGVPPTVWLVAHLDSKSQPVSLLVRAAATIAVCVAWAGVLAAWAAGWVWPVPHGVTLAFAVCAAVAAVPLVLSRPGAGSDGALDNASGVAAVLSAARSLGSAAPVGVIVTSAEEFGLAGARAWVEGRPVAIAINCDGVDDHGRLAITAGAAGRKMLLRLARVRSSGQNPRIRRTLPGILLDSTAFSDRGWTAFTVSQGTIGSLARVHTGRDSLAELSGAGVERAANLIVGLAGAIIAESQSSG